MQPRRTSGCCNLEKERPSKRFNGRCSPSLLQNSYEGANMILSDISTSPKRKKRKTRKHLRVLGLRAILEQSSQSKLKKEVGGIIKSVLAAETSRSATMEQKSWCSQSNCRHPNVSRSSSLFVDKYHLKLNKLKKTLSDSLPVSCNRPDVQGPSIHEYDSGSSMPSCSVPSRPSSPCPLWTSPGKCVAIDCEMVGTGPGGKVSELARCSVVNYVGDVIYDKYIKPEQPVFDYRTRWSGITQQHLKDAIPFKVAQKEIIAILKDKLVIGHAVHHDFQVLQYFHPWEQTRDTSKISLLNKKAGFPDNATLSLKTLAWQLLHKQIQLGGEGHSSVEDAFTTMELYRLVQDQWEQELSASLWPSTPFQTTGDASDNEQFMDDKYWPEEFNENYT